ncbi:uncharacterized protein EI90DRAFT_1516481 [Cantharellus anzutake]|uniref:uncharacterized protein n=1 Tax=Cantharellus anzutake TaxID=1750568 RepID=UPI001906EAEB|nr:uncharacterized protein EI90DRAFT_1516481 [Cantharellus anzutake]KAF8328705.1 hypothetical protein EI90DRAFT_1516481 [Cantharellus anzutake]
MPLRATSTGYRRIWTSFRRRLAHRVVDFPAFEPSLNRSYKAHCGAYSIHTQMNQPSAPHSPDPRVDKMRELLSTGFKAPNYTRCQENVPVPIAYKLKESQTNSAMRLSTMAHFSGNLFHSSRPLIAFRHRDNKFDKSVVMVYCSQRSAASLNSARARQCIAHLNNTARARALMTATASTHRHLTISMASWSAWFTPIFRIFRTCAFIGFLISPVLPRGSVRHEITPCFCQRYKP